MQTFNGIQYTAINVANAFGLDKKPFKERINWVKEHIHQLERLENYADDPILYKKAVKTLREAQAKKPTGAYIYLDASCSGLQILSALCGDELGSFLTNIHQDAHMEDAYTALTEAFNYELYQQQAKVINSGLESTTRPITADRDTMKKVIMTMLYGAKKTPREILGEDNFNLFEDMLKKLIPDAYDLLEDFMYSWQKNHTEAKYELPDGYTVVLKPYETVYYQDQIHNLFGYNMVSSFKELKPKKTGISHCANAVHSVDAYVLRSLVRRCNYKPEIVKYALKCLYNYTGVKTSNELDRFNVLFKKTNMVDVVIINHIKPNNINELSKEYVSKLVSILETMLTYKPFEITTNHDAFGVHPNNANTLRYWYKEIMAELNESTLAQHIYCSLSGNVFTYPVNNIADSIRKSNYAIS